MPHGSFSGERQRGRHPPCESFVRTAGGVEGISGEAQPAECGDRAGQSEDRGAL